MSAALVVYESMLRRHGYRIVADSNSFFVEDSEGPIAPGELDRARKWGEGLGRLAGLESEGVTP